MISVSSTSPAALVTYSLLCRPSPGVVSEVSDVFVPFTLSTVNLLRLILPVDALVDDVVVADFSTVPSGLYQVMVPSAVLLSVVMSTVNAPSAA